MVNHFEDLHGLTEDDGPQFNNLVVDKNTGRVYIGAVNKLYQLSPNLEPTVSTQFYPMLSYVSVLTTTKTLYFTYVEEEWSWIPQLLLNLL